MIRPMVNLSLVRSTVLLGMLSSFIGGCALAPLDPTTAGNLAPTYAACLAQFKDNDEIIKNAGVRDAQNPSVRGFPYLRTSRFLASFRDQLTTEEKRAAWIDQLAALDIEGREIEVRNLPPDERPPVTDIQELDRCRTLLVDIALEDPIAFDRIRKHSAVADNYQLWARTLGLYPLTSLFVLRGVERLQTNEGHYFKDAAPETTHAEKHIAYGLTTYKSEHHHLNAVSQTTRDAIGIPRFEPDVLSKLFVQHSPIWSVASISADDRIGSVAYSPNEIAVSTEIPSVYTHLTYTKFNGAVLAQLNYTIWFPARPQEGAFDILSGSLDGITWRVTLDTLGRRLFADAMHNCGCYYMAFPSDAMRRRDPPRRFEEPLWIPQSLSSTADAPVVIHISATAHYIRKIEFSNKLAIDKQLLPVAYNELRSLPTAPGMYQSMFEPNGLINGSERAERWLLWPMGIASAGAMRQVGHHAIAFIGRRHFDDPDLLDRYFESRQP